MGKSTHVRARAITLFASSAALGFAALALAAQDGATRIAIDQLGVPRDDARALVISPRELDAREITVADGARGDVHLCKRVRDDRLGAWIHTVSFTPGAAD